MKYCSECGHSTQNSQNFCSECGARFNNKSTFSDIISSVLKKTKNLIEVLKSEKSRTAIKKALKNKKVIFSLVFITSILIFSTVGLSIISSKSNPKNTVKKFQDAIINNDAAKLQDVLYSNDKKLTITEDSLEFILEYLNSNNQIFNSVLENLYLDVEYADSISYEGAQSLLDFNEIFALTIKEKNLFFTKYGITIKPIYINISSNYLNSDILINENLYSSIDDYQDSTLIGPLLPGKFSITLKSKDLFDEEITETININPASLEEYYSLEEYPLEFFSDYSTLSLDSNIPEATVFVNGKNTGIQVKDAYENFGPISSYDKIYFAVNINGTNYKTEESYANSYYGSLTLNFTYSDYKTISQYLAKNPNALTNSSNSTDSTSSNLEVSSVAKKYIDKYSSRDYIIPESNTTKLDFKGLNPYTSEELSIARNEILARHGYVDSSYPNFVSYFNSKSWYKANPSYTESDLSEIETYNYDLIKSIEFLKRAYESCSSISANYVLPNSNSLELTSSEVARLNDWELVVARNEIFARYGLEFSTKELLEHFKSKSWFVIDPSVGNDLALSAVENKNVAIILEEEKKRENSTLNHDLGE